jgi:biopolymer transport protein ExbD
MVFKIDSSSMISIKGRVLEKAAVEANLEREKAEKPDSTLIIAAHPEAETDALVTILDAAKAAGIVGVTVATSSGG